LENEIMAYDFLKSLRPRAGSGEENNENTDTATAIQVGVELARLTSENEGLKTQLAAAQESNKALTEQNTNLMTAQKAEAKRWATVAYGAGTDATKAEEAIIDAATPEMLSALTERYRAATPDALKNPTGARTTEAQGQEQPKLEGEAAATERKERLAKARAEEQKKLGVKNSPVGAK
jgi:GAF domain-containing protein